MAGTVHSVMRITTIVMDHVSALEVRPREMNNRNIYLLLLVCTSFSCVRCEEKPTGAAVDSLRSGWVSGLSPASIVALGDGSISVMPPVRAPLNEWPSQTPKDGIEPEVEDLLIDLAKFRTPDGFRDVPRGHESVVIGACFFPSKEALL